MFIATITIIPYIAAFSGFILAISSLIKDKRSFVHQVFSVAMLVLAVESFLTGLSLNAVLPESAGIRLYIRLFATALIPGTWLLFSLSFSRKNYKDFLVTWKWIIIALFLIPLSIPVVFKKMLFADWPVIGPSTMWYQKLGTSGNIFYLFILIGAVLVLMNLERTLRNATGYLRWQIKFIILGIGCIFVARLYTTSQTLLFHTINTNILFINDAALIVASLCILKASFRLKKLNIDIYLSQSFLFSSFTILFIGLYLILVGILAKLTLYFGTNQDIPIRAFFVLMAVLVLFLFLLSDRLRKRLKHFISRHFQRPLYDYRQEWSKFTRDTTSILEAHELSEAVVRSVSKTFDTLSVTIWILDEQQEHVSLGASTFLANEEAEATKALKPDLLKFILLIHAKKLPVDFDYTKDKLPPELNELTGDFIDNLQIRYCIPLVAAEKLIGIMTLDRHVGESTFSVEDFDLLQTISDQIASGLLNIMLEEHQKKLKEMEALQTMSAFFVHDLKNLASKISLTIQNLPVHFDNPEFRKDALQTLSQSLAKINLMSIRLTSLSQKLELHLAKSDMNRIIADALSGLDSSFLKNINQHLEETPQIHLDPEQIQKVITNLVLNAHEASNGNNGTITISTKLYDKWLALSVSDNGCGMSQEFIEKSLFRPFQTTKQKGMGIGLYHSKTIIEAHKGKIEVESEISKGTTFTVLLPLEMQVTS